MKPSMLKQYARRIREAYDALRAAEADAKVQAVRLGSLLNEVRAQCRYGEFMGWVQASFPFSYRTALDYMNVADYVNKNPQRAAHCASIRQVLDEVRTPRSGPPYRLKVKRWTWSLEFRDGGEYERFIELLGVLKAKGDPVPTILQSLARLAGEPALAKVA
jgi:hypothetical protein